MSVEKSGKGYRIRFRPFADKLIKLSTMARNKTEAVKIERDLLIACRTGDYVRLDSSAKEACIRMFTNQQWELPAELSGLQKPVEELTLWKAIELFVNYPGIKGSKNLNRSVVAFTHLVGFFGKDRPFKTIWVPDIKLYQTKRVSQGAANDTANREVTALSSLFRVMVELQLLEANPVRLIKRLSGKQGEREVYLSHEDVSRIASECPSWFQGVIWIAYLTGMRRGEILGLTWNQVNLPKRMVYLSATDTKEGSKKRVPLHIDVLPVFEELSKVRSLKDSAVILIDGHGLGTDTVKNTWRRAMLKLEWPKPWPRLHDLRHTWKVNALKSGVDYEVREAILGHWNKLKSVSERYGYIDETALLESIDKMKFDHGETHIWVTAREA